MSTDLQADLEHHSPHCHLPSTVIKALPYKEQLYYSHISYSEQCTPTNDHFNQELLLLLKFASKLICCIQIYPRLYLLFYPS